GRDRRADRTRPHDPCGRGRERCRRPMGNRYRCHVQYAGANQPGKKPKWTIEHSEQLRGADLVVLGDHDEAGYAHQDVTCHISLGIAKRVRILKLAEHWPECPERGDVSDWLAAGGTREQLDELIARAPDYVGDDTTEQPSSRARDGKTGS